jgi:bifunctional UDP-N-acetylglucosamine pyrophosphorylase/glucosamine-1-phosphate N-acetyltransferase
MSNKLVNCIVLAAGKGTRMKSSRAKVLHEVFFAPMIHHVLDAVAGLPLAKTVVVVGHQQAAVAEVLDRYKVRLAVQEKQLGTGHAVLCSRGELTDSGDTILILCGDTPLIRTETLEKMITAHAENKAVLTVMTTILRDPTHYGRIICDDEGNVARIVEEKDASPKERTVTEINAGIYMADAGFLFDALQRVGSDNSQGEIYLTDIVELANIDGHKVSRFAGVDAEEVLGVNSRVELAAAHRGLQRRRNIELMLSGVTMINPETISIQKGVEIEPDTSIGQNTLISGTTHIGKGCRLGANTIIHDSSLGDQVVVGSFSYLVNCQISPGEEVTPHSIRNSN